MTPPAYLRAASLLLRRLARPGGPTFFEAYELESAPCGANSCISAGASPTDKPRPQLFVSPLTGFSTGPGPGPEFGSVNDNQLWASVTGALY